MIEQIVRRIQTTGRTHKLLRRTTSSLLVACILFTMLPAAALAEERIGQNLTVAAFTPLEEAALTVPWGTAEEELRLPDTLEAWVVPETADQAEPSAEPEPEPVVKPDPSVEPERIAEPEPIPTKPEQSAEPEPSVEPEPTAPEAETVTIDDPAPPLAECPGREAVTLSPVAWSCPDYDGEAAGEYVFTASAPGYVCGEGVEWPTLTVTVEPNPPALEPPALLVRPYDEMESSDLVLSVDGVWDTYAWERCDGGRWSALSAETEVRISKEDYYTSGFRCTVTRDGGQATTEPLAEDPSALERPVPMLFALPTANGIGSERSTYMAYGPTSRNSFNIQGVDNGKTFKTTYSNGGYYVVSEVDGTKLIWQLNGTPVAMGNSLYGTLTLSLAYGEPDQERYVKVEYAVENRGSARQSFQIGSYADVMIDNNDRAPVQGIDGGLTMSGQPNNNYTFNLVAPTADTRWYGYYYAGYSNVFTDLQDKSTPFSGDSGMAWSWNATVAPGATWKSAALVGVGELPPPTQQPMLDALPKLIAGESAAITGTATPGDTVCLSLEGQEFTGVADASGNFSIQVQIPADLSADETQIDYWAVSPAGGISKIASVTAPVAQRPAIRLRDSAVSIQEDSTVDDDWFRGFIEYSSGTVSYNSSTLNTGLPGTYTVTYTARREGFPNATAPLTVTVLPLPLALTPPSAAQSGDSFDLSATLSHTGQAAITETGFVWGAMQNPTLALNHGHAATAAPVTAKGGALSATATDIVKGVAYYVRAYAKAGDAVYYSAQTPFGIDAPSYGIFSVEHNGYSFTISRTGGTDGAQTVYYRTVSGSAVDGVHFTGVNASISFADGEVSKAVTVLEHGVDAPMGSSESSRYSNADRVYWLELVRVTGGATLGNQAKAQRIMEKDPFYSFDRKYYNEYQVLNGSGETRRGDYDDDKLGWTSNGRVGSAAQETVSVHDNFPSSDYWLNTADAVFYQLDLQLREADGGYQHIQITPGSVLDLSFYPESGNWHGGLTSAVYRATLEHGGTDTNKTFAAYYFPQSRGGNPGNCNIRSDYISGQSTTSGYLRLPLLQTHLTVGYGGSGKNSDAFVTREVKHRFRLNDTREPQLLGVGSVAGTYKVGDEVTLSLVFDEIVDSSNSSLANVAAVTTWGTFPYAGGADTNVLYFTGKITQASTDALRLTSITNASGIKDMCNTAGASTADGSFSAGGMQDNTAPTVNIQSQGISGGTASAVVTASGADVLQYAWTKSTALPVSGWFSCARGATVSTRQSEGTWYLHALATRNASGTSTHTYQAFNFGAPGSPVSPMSTLALSVDNSAWAKTRTISVTKTPAAAVTYSGPGVAAGTTVAGNSVTVSQNGLYTFTLSSGGETVVQSATVSRLDNLTPTVSVTGPAVTRQTQAVTLRVSAADTGGSGVASVTGRWNDGDSFAVTGSDGAYTAVTPGAGTWTLTVTVADGAGNTDTATSDAYTVNLSAPTVEVQKTGSTDKGDTYSYTVTPNGAEDISLQLPDGSVTRELNGSFILTAPGTYYVVVTDGAGHVVRSDAMTVAANVDGTPPDVRCALSSGAWTNQDLTVTVSVYDGGSMPSVTWKAEDGMNASVSLEPDTEAGVPGAYIGTFTAVANGAYTVTATDSAGNKGIGTITVSNIDKTAPTVVPVLPADGWTAAAQTITFTYSDAASAVASAQYKLVESNAVKPTAGFSDLPASGLGVSVGENGTHYLYYKVTDSAGNVTDGFTDAIRVDTQAPTLSVTGGTAGAASLTLTISSGFGPSGGSVAVSKDGSTGQTVSGGSYAITEKGSYTFTATSEAGKTASAVKPVYAITFDGAGGSAPASQLVVSGGKATKPADPTRAGYTFAGWKQGGTACDFNAAVSADTTLTAAWTLGAPAVELKADRTQATYTGETAVILTATPSHAASDVSYSYEWYKDGTKVEGAAGATLALSTVTDSGVYTVKVTATAGALTSAQTTSGGVTVSIARATPTVTQAPTAGSITYGQSLADSVLTGGGASTEGSFAWTVPATEPAVADSGTTGYGVTFTPADGDNYTTAYTTVTLTVARKELVPSVASAVGRTYNGGTATTGALSLNGAENGEQPAATGTFAFTDAAVGEGKAVNVTDIALTEGWGDNYVLSATSISGAATTAKITPKEVGLDWSGHENLVYSGSPVSVTATATELVSGDTCDVTVKDGGKTDAGAYTAEATALSNPNYKLPDTGKTQSYIIAKAPVSFVVTDHEYDYDASAKTATVTQTADQIPSVAGQFTVGYKQGQNPVNQPTTVGEYEVWVTLDSGNFKFDGEADTTRTKQVGNLTINGSAYPDQNKITWPTAGELTYGNSLSASTLTGGGTTSAGGNGAFTWKAPETIPAVSNEGYTVVFTPNDTNYSTVEQTVSITVKPKELTITGAAAESRDYVPNDTAVTVSGGELQGVETRNETPDDVALDGSEAAGAVETPDVGNDKAVTVTGYALTGTDAGNYTLKQPEGVKVDITPAQGTATVTMEGWTYGETAKSPDPTSATNGILSVRYRYTGTKLDRSVYDSESVPTDAGTYTVTATFAATQNYREVTAQSAAFTVAAKAVTVQWKNTSHVYDGAAKSPALTLEGVETADQSHVRAALAGGGETRAGSYDVSAALEGDRAFNYTLTNPSGALLIQRAPVVFTITGNSAAYDGAAKAAAVSAEPNAPHTVLYKNSTGETVAAPTEAGTYEIWAAIDDPNYRHAGSTGGESRKIGVFTIYQTTPPAQYTVSFGPGGGTGTTAPLDAALPGTPRVLPECGFVRAGWAFTGWILGSTVYQPGERIQQPAQDLTLTAQWAQATHEIGGLVDRNGQAIINAVVTLMRGSRYVAETTTDAEGKYRFSGVTPGLYNLAGSYDGVVMTIKVTVEAEDVTDAAITLPHGKTNSVVEVLAGTPEVVVGNLETTFREDNTEVYTDADKEVVQSGGTVEIKLTAQAVAASETNEDQTAIQEKAQNVGLYLDLSLKKTVSEANGPSTTSTLPTSGTVLLESVIPLPADLQGKYRYIVHRLHDPDGDGPEQPALETLTETPNEAGEYIKVSEDKTVLTIHAKDYSLYAIAWENRSSSGGGGGPIVYPPIVTDTEHGTVEVSPKRPLTGHEVVITPIPDEGFTVGIVTVTDKNGKERNVTDNGDGTYSYTQPSGSVTITVTFVPVADQRPAWNPFTDVKTDDWFHESVKYVYEHGLMNGTGRTTFSPNRSTTRGMIVAILWRLEQEPGSSALMAFKDVAADSYYCEAVRWAAEHEIVKGYTSTAFGPDNTITRQELAAILLRYSRYKGYDVSASGSLAAFIDQPDPWAEEAMEWAVGAGIISGKGGGVLDPRGKASRAQVAAMLSRFSASVESQ